jgi:hypothetical protein
LPPVTIFHFAGSGGEPSEALNSSLHVSCQFEDWDFWAAVGIAVAIRRVRQARVRRRVRLRLVSAELGRLLRGSMVIIGDATGETPGRRTVILNGQDSERQGSTS